MFLSRGFLVFRLLTNVILHRKCFGFIEDHVTCSCARQINVFLCVFLAVSFEVIVQLICSFPENKRTLMHCQATP